MYVVGVCVTEDIDKLICFNRKYTNTTLHICVAETAWATSYIIHHIIIIISGQIHFLLGVLCVWIHVYHLHVAATSGKDKESRSAND